MTQGKTNRNKGLNAERYYAKQFREIGYADCITSRDGSRRLDGLKIDLLNIPFNAQIKAGKQTGLNPVRVLKEMDELIHRNLKESEPEFHRPNIVIVRKEVGIGNRRTKYDEFVVLSFTDFKKLISNDTQINTRTTTGI